MTKDWDGKVPRYAGPYRRGGWAEGYRAGMNSPDVKAMYEALKAIPHSDLIVAAYEAGLTETQP